MKPSNKDYEESIYNILSDIVKLKFKVQLQNSGIVFKRIFKMTNLANQQEHYLLLLDDTSIAFLKQEDFIDKFILYLQEILNDLNEQFEDLNGRRANETFVDKYAIFLENEDIGYKGQMITALLKKMRKFRGDTIPDTNNKIIRDTNRSE